MNETEVLEDRERAHLRLHVIQLVTTNRFTEAMITLSHLVAGADPVLPGTCMFCGCREDMPCGIYINANADDEGPPTAALATCAWVNDDRTVCSGARCVAAWARLRHAEAVAAGLQTSAVEPSRIIAP